MVKDKPMVGVLMGSDNDLPVVTEALKMLDKFAIPYEVDVISAHRTPERAHNYARTAADRGLKVIIVFAGGAAHLGGVIAASTCLPVIAVPVNATPLAGVDALYASVQMPAGIPVGVMAIDKPGARNAGIYAAQILATADSDLYQRLQQYKEEMGRGVEEKSGRVKQQFEKS